MNVGLAVRYDQDFFTLEIVAQNATQRFGRPVDLALIAAASLGFEFPDQRLQIPRHGSQLRHVHFVGSRAEAFAANQRFQAGHPSAPAQLGDDHGDERDDRADADEQVEHVLLGVLAAALNEAHVMHHDEIPIRRALGFHGNYGDVDQSAPEFDQPAPPGVLVAVGTADGIAAIDRIGEGERFEKQFPVDVTKAEREQALILRNAIEKAQYLYPRTFMHQFLQRFLDGTGDQGGADLQIPDKPLQGELIDQRNHRIRNCGESEGKRYDKAK